jgi:hypothetical protein
MIASIIKKTISLLTLSAFLTACAALSQADRSGKKVSGQREVAREGGDPASAEAYYHFILGYQAELSNDDETALKEYREAIKPTTMRPP